MLVWTFVWTIWFNNTIAWCLVNFLVHYFHVRKKCSFLIDMWFSCPLCWPRLSVLSHPADRREPNRLNWAKKLRKKLCFQCTQGNDSGGLGHPRNRWASYDRSHPHQKKRSIYNSISHPHDFDFIFHLLSRPMAQRILYKSKILTTHSLFSIENCNRIKLS